MTKLSGRCLCGGVRFEVENRDLEPASACHCAQCRRFAGNYWTTVNAPMSGLRFLAGEDLVTWHRSSGFARRGFCKVCGASLFYNADRREERAHRIAIALGALDPPTGQRLALHEYVAYKGDYYDITDDLPQNETE
ncbi:MAG: GFA family protein [Parvularculaceae bacterium]